MRVEAAAGAVVAGLLALTLAWPVEAKRKPGAPQSAGRSHAMPHESAPAVARDSRGRIPRSRAERSAFQKANPCPATGRVSGACPGHVVDHVVALKRGGPDHRSNMQWQTHAEAKAKDRWE